MEIHVEIIQDIPLPMAEDCHSKNYVAVESSRFLSHFDLECLTQSMDNALKRAGQDSRKRRKSRIFRCYNPSLEEIKEQTEEEHWAEPALDLMSLHKERAMNEGHFCRTRRKSRGSKNDRN